jgi:hypothetical protein
MDMSAKVVPRKRVIVGWRQTARRVAEIRSRQRTAPAPQAKRDR